MNNPIVWDNSGTPIATRFDDPYYSIRNGYAETMHVFLEGNDLPQRFAAAHHFHIAELGFGTALNFAATLSCWHRHAQRGAALTYTSFELYPLDVPTICRALAPWPDLLAIVEPFIVQLGDQKEGWHLICHGKVTLNLAVGDANRLVRSITAPVDAWYLDGFSPAKNPELWNTALMQAVADRTMTGGTFATYTAAGWVRRMLAAAGFEVTRLKGYGTKRHMSAGRRRPEKIIGLAELQDSENRPAAGCP